MQHEFALTLHPLVRWHTARLQSVAVGRDAAAESSTSKSDADRRSHRWVWLLAGLIVLSAVGVLAGQALILWAGDATTKAFKGDRTSLLLWAALVSALLGYGVVMAGVTGWWTWDLYREFKPRWRRLLAAIGLMALVAFPIGLLLWRVPYGSQPTFQWQIDVITVVGIAYASRPPRHDPRRLVRVRRIISGIRSAPMTSAA